MSYRLINMTIENYFRHAVTSCNSSHKRLKNTFKNINLTNIDDHVNFNNNELTLNQLINREVIS